jgi:hypothetical protein
MILTQETTMLGKLRPQLFVFLTFLLLVLPRTIRADLIYVTYFNSTSTGVIGEYDAGTGAAINPTLVTNLGRVVSAALDGSGNLYVSNSQPGGPIGKYNASIGATINAALVTGISGNATGVTVDGSGHLYVASYYGNSIGEYDAVTGAMINPSFVTRLDHPTYIALDSSGHPLRHELRRRFDW